MLLVHLFVNLHAFISILFLFLLVSGAGCGLCLWHSVTFILFILIYFRSSVKQVLQLTLITLDASFLVVFIPTGIREKKTQCFLFQCWAPSMEVLVPFLRLRYDARPGFEAALEVDALPLDNRGGFILFLLFQIKCIIWTASSEFGTYRLCEQRRFRRACASAQSRQNLRCSLIQAVSQEEPSDRKPDP